MAASYRYFELSDGELYKFNLHAYTDAELDEWASENGATELTEAEYEALLNPFDIEEAQSDQIDILREACESAITDDFSSDATGTTLYYCALLRDQSKMVRLSYSDMNGKLYCSPINPEDADEDGAYEFVEHTADQIQQVLSDFNTHEQEITDQFVTLRDEVLAITRSDYSSDSDCQSAIDAITWDSYVASE